MYDPKSAGADAYRDLADEIMQQDGFIAGEIQELEYTKETEEKKEDVKPAKKRKLFRR